MTAVFRLLWHGSGIPDTPSVRYLRVRHLEVTISTMGWTPGDHYCDLCGETVTKYNELVTLKRESYPGHGSAEVCSACLNRPISALLARIDDPMPRRPVRRPTRNPSLWDRLFG